MQLSSFVQQGSNPIHSILGFSFKNGITGDPAPNVKKTNEFESNNLLKEKSEQKIPFSHQTDKHDVMFARTNEIQINNEGIFIPQSIFGRNSHIIYRQELTTDGSLQIIVYAHSPRNRPLVRRRAEALDYSAEMQWLNENKKEYAGLWVALKGNQLLASGINGREVYEEALAKGATHPFLTQVEMSDDLPFGGW